MALIRLTLKSTDTVGCLIRIFENLEIRIQNWKFVKSCGEQHNLYIGGAVVVALYKLYHQPPIQKMGSIDDSTK